MSPLYSSNGLKGAFELNVIREPGTATTKLLKARENAGDQAVVGFSFASNRLRESREFSGPITKKIGKKTQCYLGLLSTPLKCSLIEKQNDFTLPKLGYFCSSVYISFPWCGLIKCWIRISTLANIVCGLDGEFVLLRPVITLPVYLSKKL